MPTNMTAEQKLALIDRHAQCEIEHDWQGALATLTEDPVPYYDYYPAGIRMRGPAAIVEQWERIFTKPFMAEEKLKNANSKVWLHDDHAIFLFEWEMPDINGVERTTTSYAIYKFQGDRIETEAVFADNVFAPVISPLFDEEFMSLPGVELIG